MKKIKIGINGFGRIGRILLRIIANRPDMEVVAVNNPKLTLDYAKYQFTHDTIFGRWNGTCDIKGEFLVVNGKKITIFGAEEPKLIPWDKVGVDVVVDATGVFKSHKALSQHIKGSVKKVIITAPADADVPMFVYGVNTDNYQDEMSVISASSCTTNCLAPLVKVIDDALGIEEAFMTTVHSATSSQKVVDGSSKKDYRGGRAASYNIIPSSSGATKATGKVVPSLQGKLTGLSFRVPTLDVSVVDVTIKLAKETTYEKIVAIMKKAEKGDFAGVIKTTDEPAVSSDFIGEPCTCVFDITAGQMLSPKFVKLIAWYDNEYGYSTQVVNLISHIMTPPKKSRKK
ncbi:MAG: type I glyceraldehyde-3-phosphate dehydrogenase [Clostridia bacterium]|nr:type I glyceraldehyde-3-phosphate dehydrogenase [Clostridia bacterium]